MLFQPAFDSLMLVRRVVVADQIDFFASGYGLIDHTQKPQPLLMAVLLTESEASPLATFNAANKVVVPLRL